MSNIGNLHKNRRSTYKVPIFGENNASSRQEEVTLPLTARPIRSFPFQCSIGHFIPQKSIRSSTWKCLGARHQITGIWLMSVTMYQYVFACVTSDFHVNHSTLIGGVDVIQERLRLRDRYIPQKWYCNLNDLTLGHKRRTAARWIKIHRNKNCWKLYVSIIKLKHAFTNKR